MNGRTILLIEDQPSDVGLTMRAFEKAHVENPLVVATDGQEALDYIFGTVAEEGRDSAKNVIQCLLAVSGDHEGILNVGLFKCSHG